jgi:hypothetical protein
MVRVAAALKSGRQTSHSGECKNAGIAFHRPDLPDLRRLCRCFQEKEKFGKQATSPHPQTQAPVKTKRVSQSIAGAASAANKAGRG